MSLAVKLSSQRASAECDELLQYANSAILLATKHPSLVTTLSYPVACVTLAWKCCHGLVNNEFVKEYFIYVAPDTQVMPYFLKLVNFFIYLLVRAMQKSPIYLWSSINSIHKLPKHEIWEHEK